MQEQKAYAALAYARANRLNRIVIDSPRPRLGIITAGKSYLDVRQALDDLGIDENLAAEIGLRVMKVGMTWPLEPDGTRHFAEGLEEILVVEEKRQHLEYQLKEELYNWSEAVRPRVIGKFDEKGEWSLPQGGWLLHAASELTPAMIAGAIAGRIARFHTSPKIEQRLRFITDKEAALARQRLAIARVPHYCSGCPHNTSTRVPEGSRALAGIGCHYMATWIYPTTTQTFSQMGGEGVAWIGQAPFTETPHVFANLGDGTYFHSGILAIRAAAAAGVNITYKILYNDAVAMTGGQPLEGSLSVAQLVGQFAAEGLERIEVVADEAEAANIGTLPAGVRARPRGELEAVQRSLRETKGTTALIYVQTCAAEKRRRRKRGSLADPARRVVINDMVCEGCGDCSNKSNCVSVLPVATEWGTKREIDQSNCNKDYSCINGFCPSFVTVEGGTLRKGKAAGRHRRPASLARSRPARARRALGHPDHRDRRHRRGHHRRHPVHGGPSRGQGGDGPRHGRPRPEGRLGLVACPHRRRPRPALGAAHRCRRGRRRDRLRHRRDRRRRIPGQDAAGPNPGGGQQRRLGHQRVRPHRGRAGAHG